VKLVARIGDRIEEVTVEPHEGRFRIRVGARTHEVEARRLGRFVRSLIVDGESHEAAVFRSGPRAWTVGWEGEAIEIELTDPLAYQAEKAHGDVHRHGRHLVTAYMPGRVVAVAVAEGDRVEPGQRLVVLEAMKMQNELQSDRAAVVRRVHVEPGEAVEGGDPLVELE
jgi:3-methylcrotonyl-CoA carboxylase alpha subunit